MSNILAIPSKSVAFLPVNKLVTDEIEVSKVLQAVYEGKYMDRALLEKDPTYRQPIPYVLIAWEHLDPQLALDEEPLYVLMQRGKGQGEARLWGKHCLGAGGHIEEGNDLLYTALIEPTQELGLPIATLSLVGVFITDSNEVDNVHLAIFYLATTHYRTFTSPEYVDQNPKWLKKEELAQHVPTMEAWAKIVAHEYLELA